VTGETELPLYRPPGFTFAGINMHPEHVRVYLASLTPTQRAAIGVRTEAEFQTCYSVARKVDALRSELSASRANERRLREALDRITGHAAYLGRPGALIGNIARAALAEQPEQKEQESNQLRQGSLSGSESATEFPTSQAGYCLGLHELPRAIRTREVLPEKSLLTSPVLHAPETPLGAQRHTGFQRPAEPAWLSPNQRITHHEASDPKSQPQNQTVRQENEQASTTAEEAGEASAVSVQHGEALGQRGPSAVDSELAHGEAGHADAGADRVKGAEPVTGDSAAAGEPEQSTISRLEDLERRGMLPEPVSWYLNNIDDPKQTGWVFDILRAAPKVTPPPKPTEAAGGGDESLVKELNSLGQRNRRIAELEAELARERTESLGHHEAYLHMMADEERSRKRVDDLEKECEQLHQEREKAESRAEAAEARAEKAEAWLKTIRGICYGVVSETDAIIAGAPSPERGGI
jgi:hypothetical protein